MKSYYGTLSRSHGCSFRISHEKVCSEPPSGGLTMVSYQACSKTSFIGNHASQIKSTMDRYHEVLVALSESVMKIIAWSVGLTITSYPVGNTTSLSRKPCMVAIKVLKLAPCYLLLPCCDHKSINDAVTLISSSSTNPRQLWTNEYTSSSIFLACSIPGYYSLSLSMP